MAWTCLLLAGLFEIGFALGLKHTEGFTRLWPSLGTAAAAAASLYLMTLAMRSIPVGTAYAVWTGIGAIGTAICGIILFGEPRDAASLTAFLASDQARYITGAKLQVNGGLVMG